MLCIHNEQTAIKWDECLTFGKHKKEKMTENKSLSLISQQLSIYSTVLFKRIAMYGINVARIRFHVFFFLFSILFKEFERNRRLTIWFWQNELFRTDFTLLAILFNSLAWNQYFSFAIFVSAEKRNNNSNESKMGRTCTFKHFFFFSIH